ncbi:MAG: phosphatidate cytidylyltransferase, partial [Clostridia bacterium]|nr:phosphatidate cytidylyltransferase [Clostridia bacterium]
MAKRIIVGILLAVLFAALLVLGGEFRMIVFSLAAVIAAYEMGKLFRAKGYRPCMGPLYVFGALHYFAIARFGYPLMLLIWFLCVAAIAVERIFSKHRTTEDAMAALVIMVYPLMLFAALGLIISGNVRSAGGILGMLLVFACPLVGDTMAYFVGSFLGKHKLCPHISPKKTVEGSVGGFIGGALGGLLCWLLQPVWG